MSIAEPKEKIKNILFDFGQVLVRFDPHYIAAPYAEGADLDLLCDVLFDRLYWDRLDAGTISDEEVVTAATRRLPPRLADACRLAYEAWPYRLPEVPGMRQLLTDLRAAHVPVYVLSNISHYFAAHTDGSPILSLTDGQIFSSEVGCVKPDRAIFARAAETFGILPAETLFVDDSDRNVDGARAAGFHAVRFDGDADALRRYFCGIGLL